MADSDADKWTAAMKEEDDSLKETTPGVSWTGQKTSASFPADGFINTNEAPTEELSGGKHDG
jgi:hypothetical protein